MVNDRVANRGASLLFAGQSPIDAADVAREGFELLNSRQVFRIVPRWRGVVVRASGAAPSLALEASALLRVVGGRRAKADIVDALSTMSAIVQRGAP